MNLLLYKVWAGVTLDQEVIRCTDPKSGKREAAKPKLRFKDDAQRQKHRMDMARREFIRKFNATFRAGDLYATLTFDDAHEVHTFAEARRVRDAYWRRLRRTYPEAVIVIVMGRGKSTSRIHFHLVAQGIPEEFLKKKWTWGMVLEPVRVLREHNYYEDDRGRKVDLGQNFQGLAAYLFNHWSEEQGGHYYKGTRNMVQPDREAAEAVEELYSDDYPPQAPPGYVYIGCDATPFGYVCFHYIKEPKIGRAGLGPAPTKRYR